MSEAYKRKSSNRDGFDPFAIMMPPYPELFSRMMQPALTACAAWLQLNARLMHSAAEASKEWLDFVGRRLENDAHYAEQIREARSPQDVLEAGSTFVQKATKDYQDEMNALAEASSHVASSMSEAVQSATERMSAADMGRSRF